jgi:2-methylcitrate dehydratase PrpD
MIYLPTPISATQRAAAPMSSKNAIDHLAEYIVRIWADEIPTAIADKLRLHVVDTLGAWIAAMATTEGRALIKFRRDLLSVGATAGKSGLFDEVAINCALVRLSEVDDIHLASMTTPGSIVIPVALTIAATLPQIDAGTISAAMIGGYEAMTRLGAAINGPDVLYRGIWPTYFAAPFGAAAVSARMLQLDERQTAHALALALTLAAPSVGQHHAPTTSRWLSVGIAARTGLTAAFAARSGFTSDVNVLQSRLFPDVYGIEPDVARMTNGWDGKPGFAQVSFKPWCAARQTMAATQALRELIDSGTATGDITKIAVAVPPPHLKMIDHGVKAHDRASHMTSLPYQMAVAALQPQTQLDISQSPSVVSEALLSFMALIQVSGDEALRADYPARWSARVEIMTASGPRERLVRDVPGDPARPLTEADIARKFCGLVESVMGEEGAQRMLQLAAAALHSPGSASELMRRLDVIAISLPNGTIQC